MPWSLRTVIGSSDDSDTLVSVGWIFLWCFLEIQEKATLESEALNNLHYGKIVLFNGTKG